MASGLFYEPASQLIRVRVFRIHLLQHNASNQSRSRVEDALNRPWRPIPSGRISERDAIRLRLGLVPFCIGLSLFYGWDVALASTLLTITTIIHDDFALAGHWVGKNACTMLGYISFEIGATKIMGIRISYLLPTEYFKVTHSRYRSSSTA